MNAILSDYFIRPATIVADPILTWADHGHAWATPLGFAVAVMVLVWPLSLALVGSLVFAPRV